MLMPSKLVLAAGLALASWQTAALAQSSPAALFDEYVAAGLPQTFSLPRSADDERGPGIDEVTIGERLDTDVTYPDGSHATTYVGTANGVEATFTRIGDELSVSVFEEQPMASATAHRDRRAVLPAVLPESDDVIVAPEARSSRAPARHDGAAFQNELQFWIFLHDQSGETNYAKFHSWYLAWWVRDLEQTVKPGVPVKVMIKDHIPGVTDFDYHKGTREEALMAFRNVADAYLHNMGVMPSGLTKSMLFVDVRPSSWKDTYGAALERGTVAMASGTGPRHGIAHEFGHNLDAQHAHAQTRFLCLTNMGKYRLGTYSCRVYTGLNDEKIREHVREELERSSDD